MKKVIKAVNCNKISIKKYSDNHQHRAKRIKDTE